MKENHRKPFLIIGIIGYFALFISVMAVIAMLNGCNLDTSSDVEYRITGTASSVDITINNSDDGTSQYDNVPLPWSYTFSQESGFFLYVSAQNQGNTGSVTSAIYVDGKVFKTSTSSGAYVIASSSGSLE